MSCNDTNLVWLDLEMTGLDPFNDLILEIATIVTDSELKLLAEGPSITIHHPEKVLQEMDDWNVQQHAKSGLSDRVRKSLYTTQQAEQETLEFLKKWVPPRCSPICGNSICHDRYFLMRLMPELVRYFHYRNLDVSAVKELALRWAPEVASGVIKINRHRAVDDIKESIEELRFYRDNFFRFYKKIREGK